MLDRTTQWASTRLAARHAAEMALQAEGGRAMRWLRRLWQFFVAQSFSSLTRRIVSLNVAGLVALVIGILYLSQFRAGLIDARIQSLLVQGEIIAGAIAASATVETDSSITIDPERLLELQTGESYGPEDYLSLEFPINPERVAPVLRRLVSPTKTRARIYDRDGVLLLDSRSLYGRGDVLRFDLPAPNVERPGWLERNWIKLRRWLQKGDLPLYRELGPENGKGYPEIAQALNGLKASMVRVNDRGEVIVSVAVPVQRFRAVRGALLLSTQGGEIDQAVEAERLQIVTVFLILLGVMVVLSMLLAAHHRGPGAPARRRRRARAPAHPLARRDSRLHRSARRDRPSVGHAARHDQRALQPHRGDRELRRRRRARAEEPADLVALGGRNPAARQVRGEPAAACSRVIQHDVKRLDRLISDISDASRLDAELQRQEVAPVDLAKLLNTLVDGRQRGAQATTRSACRSPSKAAARPTSSCPATISRLGQVIDNLIENARSFSPPGGTVRVTCRRLRQPDRDRGR